jgi:transcriptional regulator with XRE-family HTH domain
MGKSLMSELATKEPDIKGPPQNERAKRICEARKESSRNDAQIADRLGVARTSVLNWQVRGNIKLDNLRDYAEITGTSFDWLAFGEGTKTITPFILAELRSMYPGVHWSIEHAEMFRVVYMKTRDGTLNEDTLRNLNTIIEGLAFPALAASKHPTEQMVDSACEAASYLNREAVHSIVASALEKQ